MSFEKNVGSRISASKYDEPETNLDFYAKPENYGGSNIHTLNKFVYTKKRQQESRTEGKIKEKETPMDRLYARYNHICAETNPNEDTQQYGDKTHRNSILERDETLTDELLNNSMHQRSHTILASSKQHDQNETSNRELPNRSYERRRSVTAPPDRSATHITEADLRMSLDHLPRNQTPLQESPRLETARSGVHSAENETLRSMYANSAMIQSKELSYEFARQRFKHAIKIVLILLRWISTLTEKEDDDGKTGGKTFTDIATEAFAEGELKSSGIAFDVSKFKAKKEVNISKDVKHILSIPSSHRTPEQLQIALYGLQHLKSFAEYPLHMQEKLCKVAWYQQVPPKRVIIRQGHYAENFYFILSGQAVVRILDKKSNGEIQLRTAAVMRKGTSFGELALLHHSRRTATVVSQDIVQLLTIGREDFFDIFMKVSEEDGIPEHIKFTQSLDFMRHFPMEKLLEHPEACLFHFFKRGVVIVKDSNESDWLYIVKSGSCQVMKQLKGVRPNTVPETKDSTNKTNGALTKLPSLGGLGRCDGKTNTGLRIHNQRPVIASAVKRAMVQYDNYLMQSQEEQLQDIINENNAQINGGGTDMDDNLSKPKAKTPPVQVEEKPAGYSKSKFNSLVPSSSKNSLFRRSKAEKTMSSKQSSATPSLRHSAHFQRSSANQMPATAREPETEPAPMEPVFVQVDTIKPKDVFGLSTIQFDDDIEQTNTSVSLVSNGAECIMLSKKFFSQHANEQVKRTIRHLVRPYPTDETLQNNLQTKVDWDQFKQKLLVKTVVKLPIAKARRPVPLISGSSTVR